MKPSKKSKDIEKKRKIVKSTTYKTIYKRKLYFKEDQSQTNEDEYKRITTSKTRWYGEGKGIGIDETR